MCSVSREWNSVCKTNLVAQQKKQNLFDEKQAMLEEYQQENMSLKGTKKKVTGNSEAPLAVVQDLVEERVVSSTPLPLPTNHQQFVQVCTVYLFMFVSLLNLLQTTSVTMVTVCQ